MSTTISKSSDISNNVDYNSRLIIDELISKFALENSNIGVWDYIVANNTVQYSKEAKQILDLEGLEENTSSYDWQQKIHPEDLEKVINKLLHHFNNNTANYVSEHRILTQSGTYKWIKDIGKVVARDSNGNHTRVIGTIIDINQRKEQEARLSNKQNIIKDQNNRLKNFALIVTHNLKSHIANFDSLLNFHDEADNENEKNDIIDHLKTVNNSLTKTISNLTKIVSITNGKNKNIKTINIRNFASKTQDILEAKIIKTKSVITNKIDANLQLEYNPLYLESIFQNLLSNAIKYRHPDRNPEIIFNSKTTQEHIIITITDNGLGINLDKYGKDIFELYRTFHNNENSEGVGLYLTKNQVEVFGGTIEVDSTVNVGTTFTIKYPNNKV